MRDQSAEAVSPELSFVNIPGMKRLMNQSIPRATIAGGMKITIRRVTE
jgi:hypothetical protein